MEHIIQFAIGIDDEAIEKKVKVTAEKQIIDNITKHIEDAIFTKSYYGRQTHDLQSWVTMKIEEAILSHKDEIIKLAVEELANKLSRTKMAREKLSEEIK
jgi:hypothetical protein